VSGESHECAPWGVGAPPSPTGRPGRRAACVTRGAFDERSIRDSVGIQRQAKAAIARAAAELVEPDATIFVDAGTTCLGLAEILYHRTGITVMTRGLEVANVLASSENLTVVMMGGTVRPLSHGIVGPLAQIAISRMSFDLAFLSADTVDPQRGIGEPTLEETIVKEAVAGVSDRVWILADSAKFESERPPAWTSFDRPWELITDAGICAADLEAFEKEGVRVHVAPSVITPE
jgi:DeoR/GlpR family transcriptional regulator of sugar metabolism